MKVRPEVVFEQAVQAMNDGDSQRALELFSLGATQAPHLEGFWINWGALLFDQNLAQDAQEVFELGLQINPHSKALRIAFIELLIQLKKKEEAFQILEQGLLLYPQDHQLLFIHCQLYEGEQQIDLLKEFLKQDPSHNKARLIIANHLLQQGQFTQVIQLLSQTPELDQAPWLLNALGNAFKDIGWLEEAFLAYEKAIQVKRISGIEGNLLLCANYRSEMDPKTLAQLHRQWGEFHGQPLPNLSVPIVRSPAHRLRVGYLSADFRTHSVAYFFEPLLAGHRRDRVEIVCLDLRPELADPIAQRLRSYGDRWVHLQGLDDSAMNERIKSLQLDLLIELAGHSGGNKLSVCARRPAPMMGTFLGYPHSTGLSSMDIRFTDLIADPLDADQDYCEQLVRISGGFLCYQPSSEAPKPQTAPWCTNQWRTGQPFTFGSFNQLTKISEQTLTMWAAILQGAPHARLFLKARPLADEGIVQEWQKRFKEFGIESDRLILLGRTPSKQDHFALYHQIDLALDPTPYNGTTTTVEALWMGVPVVALRGNRHSARVGASILTHSTLSEFLAETVEEYISLALQFAHHPEKLPNRMHIRDTLKNSSLLERDRYAQAIEEAYFALWHRRWQEQSNVTI